MTSLRPSNPVRALKVSSPLRTLRSFSTYQPMNLDGGDHLSNPPPDVFIDGGAPGTTQFIEVYDGGGP